MTNYNAPVPLPSPWDEHPDDLANLLRDAAIRAGAAAVKVSETYETDEMGNSSSNPIWLVTGKGATHTQDKVYEACQLVLPPGNDLEVRISRPAPWVSFAERMRDKRKR